MEGPEVKMSLFILEAPLTTNNQKKVNCYSIISIYVWTQS